MTTKTKKLDAADCEAFRAHIEEQERARFEREFGDTWKTVHATSWPCTLVVRRKYICADVGTSGRYMIDRETGDIWGIKGYGKVHRGYHYGTIKTPEHWPAAVCYTTGKEVPRSKLDQAGRKPPEPIQDSAEIPTERKTGQRVIATYGTDRYEVQEYMANGGARRVAIVDTLEDAQQVVAAPDMLEALRACERIMVPPSPQLTKARAAIARAEGRA